MNGIVALTSNVPGPRKPDLVLSSEQNVSIKFTVEPAVTQVCGLWIPILLYDTDFVDVIAYLYLTG